MDGRVFAQAPNVSTNAAPTPWVLLLRAQRDACARVGLLVLPWAALCVWIALREPRHAWAWLLLACCVAIAGAWLAVAWRSRNPRWLAHQLNAHPAFEDSAGLLLGLDAPASPIAALQRSRLQPRWLGLDPASLLPPQRRMPLAWNLLAALTCAAALWTWQRPLPDALRTRLPTPLARALGVQSTALAGIRLGVQPPAYTGLPARLHDRPDIRVPEFSEVRWEVGFSVAPARAWLQFEQGPRIALQPVDGAWRATRRIDQAALYRIVAEPALPAGQRGLHRIQVIRDLPPHVRATTPSRSLSLRTPGQARWPLVFAASDDHGVAASAELRIIQTSGDGENIASTERSIVLPGRGGARARTFAYVFDLARSGLTVGNDVIVQLSVRDNRQPRPQVVRSASVILRWPPEAVGLADGMDGLAQRALPAYFRSQRQIIMDAEKLLRERPRLSREVFVRRADAIGVDQHALRLRYGQFLGEEGEEPARLPTNDADDAVETSTAHASDPATTAASDSHAAEHPPAQQGADAMLAEIGHAHDLPEAATLLDPQTGEILRAALREMWQSEMHLRQGEPARALPSAYKALAHIKRVQQADRIYLPRIGNEMPPIDFARRLGGKREGLAPRSDGWVAKPADAAPLDALWQALAADGDGTALKTALLDAATRRLATQPDAEGHALAARAALDAVRQRPACQDCRQALRHALWPLLAPAMARPFPRPAATAQGNAYLEALHREFER